MAANIGNTRRMTGVTLEDGLAARDGRKSSHGSQREDSVVAAIGGGWNTGMDAETYRALMGIDYVSAGKGRGRGTTFLDASRKRDGHFGVAYGADFVSLKCPQARTGTDDYATSHDLFRGTEDTLRAGISAFLRLAREGKRIPLAIVHTTGDTFSPGLREFAIIDLPTFVAANVNCELSPTHKRRHEWTAGTFEGVHVRPSGWEGKRGGNPADLWVDQDLVSNGYGGDVYRRCAFSVRKLAFTQTSDFGVLAAAIDAATRPVRK